MARKGASHATASFGSRYGASVRKRYAKIYAELKSRHYCPRCDFPTLKRVSVGVWRCKKCGFTIAGGAYTPATKLEIKKGRESTSS